MGPVDAGPQDTSLSSSLSHSMKPWTIVIWAASLVSFLYHVKVVGEVRAEISALRAEVAMKTSTASLVTGSARSFFDGLTLGAFAEEGIFTESNKYDRWSTDAARRDALLKEKYSQTSLWRNWSAGILVGSSVVLFLASRKQAPAASSAGVPNAT